MAAATFEEYLRGSEISRLRAPGMVLLKAEDEVVAYLLANISELVTLPRSSAFQGIMPEERDEIEAAAVAALQSFGERLFAEFGPRDWQEDELLQRAADALESLKLSQKFRNRRARKSASVIIADVGGVLTLIGASVAFADAPSDHVAEVAARFMVDPGPGKYDVAALIAVCGMYLADLLVREPVA